MILVFRTVSLTALLVALCGASTLRAQTTNQPPAGTNAPGHKKSSSKTHTNATHYPYHGALKAVNSAAKTFQVGNTTYHVTAETKITKAGKPATLDQGVIGEQVGGSARRDKDDNRIALTVNFGPKPEKKPKKQAGP